MDRQCAISAAVEVPALKSLVSSVMFYCCHLEILKKIFLTGPRIFICTGAQELCSHSCQQEIVGDLKDSVAGFLQTQNNNTNSSLGLFPLTCLVGFGLASFHNHVRNSFNKNLGVNNCRNIYG